MQLVKQHDSELTGADGVRAIACLMVIAHHFFQRLAFPVQSETVKNLQLFLMTGNSGVSVFFVLSGFLLAWPFWRRYLSGEQIPDLGVFAKRRAARIMPGFYVNLVFCFVLSLFIIPDATESLARFIAGLTFTAGFNWLSLFPAEINGPLWSIGFEVISYALLPLFMLPLFAFSGNKRSFGKGLVWWIAVWLIVMGANQLIQVFGQTDNYQKGWEYGIVGGAKFWWPSYNPIGFFGHYSLGIIAAGVTVHLGRSGKPREKVTSLGLFDVIVGLALVGILCLLWFLRAAPEFSFSLQHQPYYFPIFPALIAIILATLPHSRVLGRIFDNPFAKYTAKISFGLYIWHYLIMEIIAMTIAPNFHYFGIADIGEHLVLCGIVLVASYGIASLSWFLLEKRVLDWAHARTSAKPELGQRQGVIQAAIQKNPAMRIGLITLVAAVLVTVPVVVFLSSPRQAPIEETKVSAGTGTLSVQVSGIKAGAQVVVVLYDHGPNLGPDNFRTFKTAEPGSDGLLQIQFQDLEFGDYAVFAFQDSNGNNQPDFGAEGMCSSSSVNGASDFELAKQRFDIGQTTFNLKMDYPQ